ncbi:MAG: hypothetical protein ACOH5I_23280 [Oligoflexus sp.]
MKHFWPCILLLTASMNSFASEPRTKSSSTFGGLIDSLRNTVNQRLITLKQLTPSMAGSSLVVSSDDLSEHSGYLTWKTDLTSNQTVRLTLDLADIFVPGSYDPSKKMIIDLTSMSDLSPVCSDLVSRLNLRGVTSCLARTNNRFVKITNAGSTHRTCTRIPDRQYKTEQQCYAVPLKPSCGNGRNFGEPGTRPICESTIECRDVTVYSHTIYRNSCDESTNSLDFTVNGFAYNSRTDRISSSITINRAHKTIRNTLNGQHKNSSTAPIPNLANREYTVETDAYLQLTCLDGSPVGGRIRNFQAPHTVYYSDLVESCGEDKVVIRSNRPLLFDQAALFLMMDNPY